MATPAGVKAASPLGDRLCSLGPYPPIGRFVPDTSISKDASRFGPIPEPRGQSFRLLLREPAFQCTTRSRPPPRDHLTVSHMNDASETYARQIEAARVAVGRGDRSTAVETLRAAIETTRDTPA